MTMPMQCQDLRWSPSWKGSTSSVTHRWRWNSSHCCRSDSILITMITMMLMVKRLIMFVLMIIELNSLKHCFFQIGVNMFLSNSCAQTVWKWKDKSFALFTVSIFSLFSSILNCLFVFSQCPFHGLTSLSSMWSNLSAAASTPRPIIELFPDNFVS